MSAHQQSFNTKQAPAAFLNPLADNNFSGMTHNERGLRAASHVSMEHTAHAHEYNPTCVCHDCQDVVSNFTNYSILDAYTAVHLQYEAKIQAVYGYVPAKGTPYNYVVKGSVCVGRDPVTGCEMFENEYEYTNTYFFHSHLYEMKAITDEVKQRSYQRFFENNNTNNNVNVAPALDMPAPRRQNRAYQQNNNNNTKVNAFTRAFATHNNVHHNNNNNNARHYYSNNHNNNYASNNFQNYYAPQQQQYEQNQASPFYYTRSDVDQAAQDVAFSGVATLGN